jgi:hypothetical protein
MSYTYLTIHVFYDGLYGQCTATRIFGTLAVRQRQRERTCRKLGLKLTTYLFLAQIGVTFLESAAFQKSLELWVRPFCCQMTLTMSGTYLDGLI